MTTLTTEGVGMGCQGVGSACGPFGFRRSCAAHGGPRTGARRPPRLKADRCRVCAAQ